MADNRQRFERMLDEILSDLNEPGHLQTRSIVEALRVVALELSELNVAASHLMSVADHLPDVVHHLERMANRD